MSALSINFNKYQTSRFLSNHKNVFGYRPLSISKKSTAPKTHIIRIKRFSIPSFSPILTLLHAIFDTKMLEKLFPQNKTSNIYKINQWLYYHGYSGIKQTITFHLMLIMLFFHYSIFEPIFIHD